MQQLILHIGTHKTGTTSIQKALADNRAWLRERGLVYPDGGAFYKRHPHHHWSHSLTGDERRRPEAAQSFVHHAVSLARPNDTLLISAESIYRHVDGFDSYDVFGRSDYWERRERYIRNCAAVLSRFDVRVVVWFREKESFAQSLYAEMIAKGYWQGPFDAFSDFYDVWFQYDRQLDLFQKIFPRTEAFSYEEDCRSGLVPTFFARVGAPVPPGVEGVWERRTKLRVSV